MLGSQNLPQKSNFQNRKGFDAITGKANFDISEWMLLKHLDWLQTRKGALAMLCKTSVARKVLIQAWKKDQRIDSAKFFSIDALKNFDASVDACLFFIDCTREAKSKDCEVYDDIQSHTPSHTLGYHDNTLIADVEAYQRWQFLRGTDKDHVWRSGLKHDCSKVMELTIGDDGLINGFGQNVSLEEEYVFPLYKSSDVGNGRVKQCRKYVIVTQHVIGEDTAHIKDDAPKTWKYLNENKSLLDKRGSVIYKKRPPFSIFGVGDYTFAPWKVAISGFYKNLSFQIITPLKGRPVMLDDTVNFLPCGSKDEAELICSLLNSEPAQEFLSSMIFWSEKRPITIEILRRLNIVALATKLGRQKELDVFKAQRNALRQKDSLQQVLFAS